MPPRPPASRPPRRSSTSSRTGRSGRALDRRGRPPAGRHAHRAAQLIEFAPAPQSLLSLILSGPPELKTQLEAPELFPLERRRIPPSLKDELFERTRGAPALVDRVVAYALVRTAKMLGGAELQESLDVTGL